MQAEITSDDSIIRHHYQHQNVWPGAGSRAASVTGWYGLHFANRPCPRLIFYACQSNTVMTACIASLPNKTQISLWWLRSLIRRSTEGILLKASQSRRGESVYRTTVSLDVFTVVCPGSIHTVTVKKTIWESKFFPPRRCDLLLAFVCVSVQRFKLHREEFIPGSRGSEGSPVICKRYPKSSDCSGRFILKHDGNVLD